MKLKLQTHTYPMLNRILDTSLYNNHMSGAVKRARYLFRYRMFSTQISTCNLRDTVLIYLFTIHILCVPKPERLLFLSTIFRNQTTPVAD